MAAKAKKTVKSSAALATSVGGLVREGKVTDLRYARGGGVAVTVEIPAARLKTDALRRTLAAITEHLM